MLARSLSCILKRNFGSSTACVWHSTPRIADVTVLLLSDLVLTNGVYVFLFNAHLDSLLLTAKSALKQIFSFMAIRIIFHNGFYSEFLEWHNYVNNLHSPSIIWWSNTPTLLSDIIIFSKLKEFISIFRNSIFTHFLIWFAPNKNK